MAINISINLLKKRGLFFSFRSRPFQTIFFRLKRIFLEQYRIYKRRKLIRKMEPIEGQISTDIALGVNFEEASLEKYQKEYESNKYTYIENFFSSETHNKLCDSFPNELFFNYPRNGSKFYSWSDESRWIRGDNTSVFSKSNGKEFFQLYPHYRKLYDFLDSKEMSEKVKIITNSKEAELYSISITRAKEGCFLSPHLDTVSKDRKPNEKIMMNFIYFLLAGGGSPENCGGTGLYLDNEFNNPVFIPKTLRNSALLYDSIEQYSHGFDLMVPGSFRWAIVFQFKISS